MRPAMPGLVALVGLVSPPALAARTTDPPSITQLAASATTVVHARVTAAHTTHDDGRRVKTTYSLDPIATLAGNPAEELSITIPGGVVGDRVVQATGVPVWSVGEQVVVFVPAQGRVDLDGLLTVQDGLVLDAAERPAEHVPATLSALAESLAQAPSHISPTR